MPEIEGYDFLRKIEQQLNSEMHNIVTQLQEKDEKDTELLKQLLLAQENLNAFYDSTHFKTLELYQKMANPTVI